MKDSPAPSRPFPAEPTLADLIGLAWRARYAILAGGLVGLIAGLIFMALAVPRYRAVMLVAPVTRIGTADLGGPMPANASFATEYMLKSFSGGDTSDFTWFEHVLREPSVAARLMNDPLVRAGVAGDRPWRFLDPQPVRTPEELAAYLQKQVAVEPVGGTPLRRVMYDHADPAFARDLLRALYIATDAMIRGQMQAKADDRIRWLQRAVAASPNAEDRRSLTALLTEQQQLRVMMDLDEPYAARIAEPPAASVKPVWPRKVLVVPVFTLCGLLLGFVAFAARVSFRSP